jgi:MraZ protein
MAFEGTAEYSLDAKNRLTVPARFRADFGAGLTLAKGIERCVALWKPADYDAYRAAALQGMHPLSLEARKLKTYFSANSMPAELDAAGRVMVPGFLMEHANLSKEVTVIGAEDHLQLWERSAWADYNQQLHDDVVSITSSLGHPA